MTELTIQQVPYDFAAAQSMIADLQDYYRTLYDGPDRSPVDPDEFAPPNGRFFAGFVEGEAVAMGGWRRVPALVECGYRSPVEVKRMYVVPSARGRGLARRMLSHLELTAAAQGADSVILTTGPPQVDAIALYRSSGYVAIPRFGYFARYADAVHLGKALPGKAPGPETGAASFDESRPEAIG